MPLENLPSKKYLDRLPNLNDIDLFYPGVHSKLALRENIRDTCFIDIKTKQKVKKCLKYNSNKFFLKKPHYHLS